MTPPRYTRSHSAGGSDILPRGSKNVAHSSAASGVRGVDRLEEEAGAASSDTSSNDPTAVDAAFGGFPRAFPLLLAALFCGAPAQGANYSTITEYSLWLHVPDSIGSGYMYTNCSLFHGINMSTETFGTHNETVIVSLQVVRFKNSNARKVEKVAKVAYSAGHCMHLLSSTVVHDQAGLSNTSLPWLCSWRAPPSPVQYFLRALGTRNAPGPSQTCLPRPRRSAQGKPYGHC